MKKFFKKIIICTFALVLCLAAFAGCGDSKKGDNNVVKLKDNGEILTNPDMGFNFTYYANTIYDFNTTLHPGDYLDEFPCDTVFFRIGWNWIEPKEGEFDWEFTDKIAEEWIARGKNIAFAWAVTFPGDQSTPLWVKDAGAEGVQYTYVPEEVNGKTEYMFRNTLPSGEAGTGGMAFSALPLDAQEFALNKGIRKDTAYNGGNEVQEGDYENYRGTWVVKYDDPIFLEKWDNFLAAAAERYDNNSAVQFVEIGSFGDWGEGHNSYTHGNPIGESVKKTHIDLYLKHFKNIQLMVNDDAMKDTALVTYTRDNGIGLSDHSVQVSYPDLDSPEGGSGNVAYAKLYYRQTPILLEHHNGTTFYETYYNSIVDCHASYARINCNPYTAALSPWKDKIALKLGYRLVFSEVSFSEISPGANVKFDFTMTNEGSAPCYKGGNPTFYLVDSLGRVHATATSEFDVSSLSVAERGETAKAMTGTAQMQLPDALIEDDYYICVAVTKDGKEQYKLPLDHRDGNRMRYRIATFTVGG